MGDGRRMTGEQRVRVGVSSTAGGGLRACAVCGAAAVPGRQAASPRADAPAAGRQQLGALAGWPPRGLAPSADRPSPQDCLTSHAVPQWC